MSAKPVSPDSAKKYIIPGKDKNNNKKDLALTIDDSDMSKYVVNVLDGSDLRNKIPASASPDIFWFTGFSVTHTEGKKFSYSFTVNLDKDQKLFVAYGGAVYDVTAEIKNNGKVTLTEGDPGAGTIP